MYVASSVSATNGVRIEAIELAETRLGEVVQQSALPEKVRSSMARLGLESRGRGERPPLDFLVVVKVGRSGTVECSDLPRSAHPRAHARKN